MVNLCYRAEGGCGGREDRKDDAEIQKNIVPSECKRRIS